MSNRPICDTDTPDPWMIEFRGCYYLTFTSGDHIEVWSSQSVEGFKNCTKSLIWRPEPGAPWSDGVWAPELHFINNTWYIYVACAHPAEGNPSHRTVVLRSSSMDPQDPAGWNFLGPLKGLPDHWNIDLTVFELNSRLYCCYSGWPLGDYSDTEQDLFLMEMNSPEEAKSDSLITISKPELDWEIIDNHGINEGPQFLVTPNFIGIVYSACGSWTNKYKLAVLQLTAQPERIMEPQSWMKWERPLMMSDPEGIVGPHGPGHASFVHERSGTGRVFCVYHATGAPTDGWANRKAHVCCLGPEIFLGQTETLICGLTRPSNSGGNGIYGAADGRGKSGHSRGQSIFDKVKDRVKNKLREL